MTKRLILLRHAKSAWHTAVDCDFHRPLNHRGSRDAPRVGEWLKSHSFQPDVVLCSTAVRTRETLDEVFFGSGWDENRSQVRFLDSLYLASRKTIIDEIETALHQHDSVMVVAHNPGLDLTLLELYPDSRYFDGEKLMTTATIAILDWENEFGGNVESVQFARPGDFEK